MHRMTHKRCFAHAHLSMLMRLLATEPRSTAILLLPFHCLCGTILLTRYLIVWDWRVLRPMLLYWQKFAGFRFVFQCFQFIFFVSIGWYSGAGVIGLIGCVALSWLCIADVFS